MGQQVIADEREYRRGLVLGFTLAEVLLLLLFLVLLALGAKLQGLDREREGLAATAAGAFAKLSAAEANSARLRDEVSQLNVLLETVKLAHTGDVNVALELGRERGQAQTLRDRIKDLESQLVSLAPEPKDRSRLAELVKQAKKVDPNDPIDFLERSAAGKEQEVPHGFDAPLPELLSDLKSIGPTKEERAALTRTMTSAKEIATNDPAGAIEKAWVAFRTNGGPQPVSRPASKSGHDWPPIIRLSEADGYFFPSGSAELPDRFRNALSGSVMDKLASIIEKYQVDVVEVIGHTDEQPLVVRPSNLDKTIIPYLQHQVAEPFAPSDNAGLGFARAVAVTRVLSADPRLQKLRVLPLSAAHVIDLGDLLTDGSSAAPKEDRRRIEIRVRRSASGESANR